MKSVYVKNRLLYVITSALIIFNMFIIEYAAGGPGKFNIKEGDEWHYFKGETAPPDKWHYRDFDDSSWLKGAPGFGYGVGKHNTVLDDMKGRYQNVYVRKEFTVRYHNNHNRIKKMALSVVCDGPFVAYLNMIEAVRSNKRGHGDPLILTGFGHELDPGTNVLSIKCSNDDINSENFSFIPTFDLIEE